MAEISGYLIEQRDLHRLRRLVRDLDRWHITFAATEECDFVELLRTLLGAPAPKLIQISDLLPRYSDLLSQWDPTICDSPVKLQITEVVATLASLDSNLSDLWYFKFAADHFDLLLAESRVWEVVPTTTSLDVLTSLDLKDAHGNNLVGNVQEAFKNARTELRRLPNSQNLLCQFEIPYLRFHNWYKTLSAFGGSEEQGNQIISRRIAIIEALEDVFTITQMIGDTTKRRVPEGISDLNQSVRILINTTPVAREQHLDSLHLNKAEPPQSPLSTSRANPSRTMAVSSDPRYLHPIEKVLSNHYARTIVGGWGGEGRDNSWPNVTARGHSMMIADNVYEGRIPYPGEQPGVEGTSPQISEKPSTVSKSGEATSKMPGDFQNEYT
ncbi:hypothetical protein LTR24_010071 [Lithohypha guttulata]|uniref:Uncharacterized protein n=1 Tax=Lithohypha guttulata TaxID=1690604 RepID=A0ABR0JVE3_9EURO|nr:hypothetical protein LTR24_010071 [Lithohypha guttulata]